MNKANFTLGKIWCSFPQTHKSCLYSMDENINIFIHLKITISHSFKNTKNGTLHVKNSVKLYKYPSFKRGAIQNFNNHVLKCRILYSNQLYII